MGTFQVIGLTGGIATGKSTVAAILTEMGVPVIDADQVAREVVEPGQPALARIVEAFGPEVLDGAGRLDRAAMRRRISHDPQARQALEAITHPAIREAIGQRLVELAQSGAPAAVVEAALLVETGSYRLYPKLIVVTCPPELQLARLLARDSTHEADARALIAAQLPLADKEAVATHVIRNEGDLEELRRHVRDVWAQIVST